MSALSAWCHGVASLLFVLSAALLAVGFFVRCSEYLRRRKRLKRKMSASQVRRKGSTSQGRLHCCQASASEGTTGPAGPWVPDNGDVQQDLQNTDKERQNRAGASLPCGRIVHRRTEREEEKALFVRMPETVFCSGLSTVNDAPEEAHLLQYDQMGRNQHGNYVRLKARSFGQEELESDLFLPDLYEWM